MSIADFFRTNPSIDELKVRLEAADKALFAAETKLQAQQIDLADFRNKVDQLKLDPERMATVLARCLQKLDAAGLLKKR